MTVPLDRDGSRHFLPWTTAFMVFLAVQAAAGAMVMGGVASSWTAKALGALTVEVGRGSPALVEERLRHAPGVLTVHRVTAAEAEALLDPWLGPKLASMHLPLPTLFDLAIDPVRGPSPPALKALLAEVAPDAVIDDHKLWMRGLITLARFLELLALTVLALTVLVTGLTVVFATTNGLAAHARVISLMHMMGATDPAIAGQFGRHFLVLALAGGAAGAAAAVPAVLGLSWLAHQAGIAPSPLPPLSPLQWGAIALLPAGAGLLAMVTARLTVLRALGRMS